MDNALAVLIVQMAIISRLHVLTLQTPSVPRVPPILRIVPRIVAPLQLIQYVLLVVLEPTCHQVQVHQVAPRVPPILPTVLHILAPLQAIQYVLNVLVHTMCLVDHVLAAVPVHCHIVQLMDVAVQVHFV